jgi:hypothetical protein
MKSLSIFTVQANGGFQGRVMQVDFALPGQIAFLKAHGIHGVHTEHFQPVRFAGGHERLKDGDL